MEKVLLPAYWMNSRVCDFIQLHPDRIEDVLCLYMRYVKDCSLAKRKLERGIKDLYTKSE